jgi:hypothetical protein
MATLPKKKLYAPKADRTTLDIATDMARAATQGATLGFSDEMYGLYKSFVSDKTYEEARDEVREGLERFRESDPVKAYGLEILGSLLTGLGTTATAARLGAQTGIKTAAALGAGEGALYGAGVGETPEERLTGAGTGLAIGGTMGGVGQAIMPKITQGAKSMMGRGYPLTAGQAFGGRVKSMEEKISLPFAQEMIQEARRKPMQRFSQEAVENAIKPLGKEIDKNLFGEQAVEAAEDIVSEAYQEIVPKLSIDVEPLDAKINSIVSENVQKGFIPPKDASDTLNVLNDIYRRNITDGKLSKQLLKDTESELSSEIFRLTKGSANDRRMARTLRQVQSAMRDEIAEQNKGVADLQKVNQAFKNLKPIKAASEASVAKAGEFTPTQLLRRKEMKALPPTAPEKVLAREARDVIGATVPDSGSAGRFLASEFVRDPLKTGLGVPASLLMGSLYGTGAGRGTLRGLMRTPAATLKYSAPAVSGLLAPQYDINDMLRGQR